MNKFSRLASMLSALALVLLLSNCEQYITVDTTVNEDGSIDRTVTYHQSDSAKALNNLFNAAAESGWNTSWTEAKSTDDNATAQKYDVTFSKHFNTIEQANEEMDNATDTVLRIRTEMATSFNWLFTNIHYSETYRSTNRFRILSEDTYVTDEDRRFISRLPAESQLLNPADSAYLAQLNEKLFDHYASRAIFEEYFDAMLSVMKQFQVNEMWVDTLQHQKEVLFDQLVHSSNTEDDFMEPVIDSLKIPLTADARQAFRIKSREVKSRIMFMSAVTEGKYTHIIRLPWEVQDTNADSIANNTLYWRPRVMKILLTDYTMYAEARKWNGWMIAAGIAFIALITWLFLKRK